MRFGTLNTLHGRSPRDGRVEPSRFTDAIASLDVDVLALQEVDRFQVRSRSSDFAALAAEAMGAADYRFAAVLGSKRLQLVRDTGPNAARAYGIALLSRYPVRSWRAVRLGTSLAGFPAVSRPLRRVIWVQDEPRVAIVAEIETALGVVTVVSTHLSFTPFYNRRQLARLARHLDASGPLVLMGDLNMRPRAAQRVSRLRGAALHRTFPAWMPRTQLDHVLISGDLPEPAGSEARALDVSDHRALLVDF